MSIDPQPGAPHDLLAAYVLDAVEEDERRTFEEHLLDCPTCTHEIDALAPTLEALGSSASVTPPAHLRGAVLHLIGRDADVSESDPEAPSPEPASAGLHSEPAGSTPPETGPEDMLAARRASKSSRRLVILAGAAAAVAVFMALVFGPLAGSPQLTPETIAAAADAERYDVQLGEATATIIVSRSLDKVAIETAGMEPAPEGQDYQLWLSRPDGTLVPAGLMPDTEDPAMVLPDDLGDAVGLGITMEPAGGSPQPTTEPLALVPFEA